MMSWQEYHETKCQRSNKVQLNKWLSGTIEKREKLVKSIDGRISTRWIQSQSLSNMLANIKWFFNHPAIPSAHGIFAQITSIHPQQPQGIISMFPIAIARLSREVIGRRPRAFLLRYPVPPFFCSALCTWEWKTKGIFNWMRSISIVNRYIIITTTLQLLSTHGGWYDHPIHWAII